MHGGTLLSFLLVTLCPCVCSSTAGPVQTSETRQKRGKHVQHMLPTARAHSGFSHRPIGESTVPERRTPRGKKIAARQAPHFPSAGGGGRRQERGMCSPSRKAGMHYVQSRRDLKAARPLEAGKAAGRCSPVTKQRKRQRTCMDNARMLDRQPALAGVPQPRLQPLGLGFSPSPRGD